MFDGFIRVCASVPEIKVANCGFNTKKIINAAKEASEKGAKIVVFPELCITGYTCSDLFLQPMLLQSAKQSLLTIAKNLKDNDIVTVVGLPLPYQNSLYNCAAVLKGGDILGIVAKYNIPNYSEFYEARHFTSAVNIPQNATLHIDGKEVPFGCNIIFCCENLPDLKFGVEICEDLWVVAPPSQKYALAGATVILNPSAGDETIAKPDYRRLLVKSHSARLICAYVYSGAGDGESTTDMVFSGHSMIAENGRMMSETQLFKNEAIYADIDYQKLLSERRRMNTFGQDIPSLRSINFTLKSAPLTLNRYIDPYPFVPADENEKEKRCENILNMQANGLKKRLSHTGCKTAIIGLSGGLDSTLALLVTHRAFSMLGLDPKGIIAVTMPCFGTTKRTKSNAQKLAECLKVTFDDIDITKSVLLHFDDIGHDKDTLDVTYENGQARERTQVLMNLANQHNGLVIGTGDLSELALGWATYNGDHMSMYGVNVSVPKTLVRHIVRYVAEISDEILKDILYDVLDTPVSPELLPPSHNGEISQKTESIVGPYELHDFFLYTMLRLGFTPKKVFRLACIAFEKTYEPAFILKWEKTFYKRFFSQQFKRSCLPDGPKVGTVALSPRGDLRMPSDACADLWLAELETIKPM